MSRLITYSEVIISIFCENLFRFIYSERYSEIKTKFSFTAKRPVRVVEVIALPRMEFINKERNIIGCEQFVDLEY